ncbi:MAG: hypothetical protein ACHQJ6_07840 [Candidatus Berkiellales bacterium]
MRLLTNFEASLISAGTENECTLPPPTNPGYSSWSVIGVAAVSSAVVYGPYHYYTDMNSSHSDALGTMGVVLVAAGIVSYLWVTGMDKIDSFIFRK